MAEKKKAGSNDNKLSKALLKKISEYAAEIAVEKYSAERKRTLEESKNNRFRNAKLLMKKYRWLKEYSENAVYTTAQICSENVDELLILMGAEKEDRYAVASIRNGVMATEIIMEHIDTMLNCYSCKCLTSKKPEIQRRWRVLRAMYIAPEIKTAPQIADEEHISISMVYTDVDSACEELSSLLFGIDLSEFLL